MTTPLSGAVETLRSARQVTVLGHVYPDADALGSALALGLALERAGTAVQVSFSEPATVPRSLSALPGRHLVVPADRVRPGGLVVTVDVNVPRRLGALAALLPAADDVLVIDHHATNTRFGRVNLVDPAAVATTVLIAELLDALDLPIDREIADNLYAGLATDSVGFRHGGPRAHLLAARLLECGVQPDRLMRPITEQHPPGFLPLLATVLGRAAFEQVPGLGQVVWTYARQADCVGVGPEESDAVIDILRTVDGPAVSAVFKELPDGRWQVSLRSVPGTDVSAVAVALGGGGHPRAAGFTHSGDLATAVAGLMAALGA